MSTDWKQIPLFSQQVWLPAAPSLPVNLLQGSTVWLYLFVFVFFQSLIVFWIPCLYKVSFHMRCFFVRPALPCLGLTTRKMLNSGFQPVLRHQGYERVCWSVCRLAPSLPLTLASGRGPRLALASRALVSGIQTLKEHLLLGLSSCCIWSLRAPWEAGQARFQGRRDPWTIAIPQKTPDQKA